jgi:hypothetical protein
MFGRTQLRILTPLIFCFFVSNANAKSLDCDTLRQLIGRQEKITQERRRKTEVADEQMMSACKTSRIWCSYYGGLAQRRHQELIDSFRQETKIKELYRQAGCESEN